MHKSGIMVPASSEKIPAKQLETLATVSARPPSTPDHPAKAQKSAPTCNPRLFHNQIEIREIGRDRKPVGAALR